MIVICKVIEDVLAKTNTKVGQGSGGSEVRCRGVGGRMSARVAFICSCPSLSLLDLASHPHHSRSHFHRDPDLDPHL